MENKYVGYLLMGVSILIIVIILLFSSTLKNIHTASCSMGNSCPMYGTIDKQKYLSLIIVGLLLIVSLILIFSKPSKEIIIRKVEAKKQKKKFDTSNLKPEEKKVLGLIQANKAIFQAELIEKTSFGKAKVTRILDRLEGRGFVERKRRGMTNVVVLKE